MSNVWYYQAFYPIDGKRTGVVKDVFTILKKNDCFILHPELNSIKVTNSKFAGSLSFKSIYDAGVFLEKNGGLLQVWKLIDQEHDWYFDFEISMDLMGERNFLCLRQNKTLSEIGFGDITISLGSYNFCQHDPDDSDQFVIARSILKLFLDICINLNVVYGYSLDEDFIEYYRYDIECIPYYLCDNKIPDILFWLTYISKNYLSNETSERLNRLNIQTENLKTGVLIKLFDMPWNVQLSALQKINQEWRNMLF